MDSEKKADPIDDNRDLSHHSHRSTKKDSRASSLRKHKRNFQDKIQNEDKNESGVESRSKTRTWGSDPDRDRMSEGDGRGSDGSFYSEDYENVTPSERSLSPLSQSQTPSPTLKRGLRAKQISRNNFYKTAGGAWRRGVSRPQRPGGLTLTQQHRKVPQSQSKESTPPKDLDLVTKKMLSARLLKINELRNALSELQQRTDDLQKENRILKQLQVRQEKALRHYDDTESEISQLLSRHSNEIHVLHERLRRTQERERAAERRLKDSEEQLKRSQMTVARLKKLVDQRELGARDELSRKLEEETTRTQEAERKLKELERCIELSNSSHQRQLVAEKKKMISSQEEIRNLQEEVERLTNKLKEKERELDARNIYANRMMKPSLRKETDSGTKQKGPSRNSTKAVQTQGRASSLDFPTPPPAISDVHEYSEPAPDEYLSLKQLDRINKHTEVENNMDEEKKKEKDVENEPVKQKEQNMEPKQQLSQDPKLANEKANRLKEGNNQLMRGLEKEKDEEEDKKRTGSLFAQKEKENYWKQGHVQEEVSRWNQESLSSQQAAEEMRQKKEQLLAKMREIDRQNQGPQDSMFAESSVSESIKTTSDFPSPHPPEQRNHNSLIFSLTELEEKGRVHAGIREAGRRRPGVDSGAVAAGIGRRALRSQTSSDELAFGSYAPSFGNSTSRASSGFPPPPPKEDRDSALEATGFFNLRGMETEKKQEDKKANLLQQLFGTQVTLSDDGFNTFNKMEVLNSPLTPNGVRSRREGLLGFSSGSPSPPAASMNTLQVAESRPAIRAIASFDEEIEELTL